jgi:polyene macrolide polyketide synthase
VGLPRIEELTLLAPLTLREHDAITVQLTVDAPNDTGRRSQIRIHAHAAGAWTLHATGVLAPDQSEAVPEELPEPSPDSVELPDLYAGLAESGFAYGPAFRGLSSAWSDGDAVIAEVALPEACAATADRFGLHPALLDAVLHASAHLDLDGADGEAASGRLPFSWHGVRLHATGARAVRARLTRQGADIVAITLVDTANTPVATVEGLALRAISPEGLTGLGEDRDPLHLEWIRASSAPPHDAPVAVLGRALGDLVTALGPETIEATDLAELTSAGPVPARVLVGIACDDVSADAAHRLIQQVRELAQAWLAEPGAGDARLVLVTRGATGPDRGPGSPAEASVWGLIRSAQSEHPGRFELLDLDDADASRAEVRAALGCDEAQIAIRDGVVQVPRVERGDSTLAIPENAHGWCLDILDRGTLTGLALAADARGTAPLAAGEIRIAVRSAGVNFRDVLNALGMYPGEAPDFGLEGAGVVIEVGEAVHTVAVGDRVFGMFPGAFGPHAVADHRTVAPIPAGWSFAQAAAVPITFLTAYFGLVDLAGLRAGQSVLVHAAAGGVGTAAVQIGQHLGATVHGTASPSKWSAVTELGVSPDHLSSSRTLDFEKRVLDATDGEGVDVVLDALAGEFVDASLRVLPRGGHFLEMGKTDVRDPETVARDHPGVRYRAFDLIEAGPDRIQEMLAELSRLFTSGVLRPPRVTAWDVREAPHAFRHLSQARHIGKVVLTMPHDLAPDGTVLITGGTGNLGAAISRRLVERHGVRRLLLASRRGAEAEGAQALRADLEEYGAEVAIAACDTSDRDSLAALLAGVSPENPLTAVVHTAGVLDDTVIEKLGAESLDRVLAAKADSAWHLHELTRDADLARFVVFSSAAGVLGAPGQANYAAANAFADALAEHRCAAGLPATSLAWGPWRQGGGMTATLNDADVARMARSGIRALRADEGLALFDTCWRRPEPVLLPLQVDAVALAEQPTVPALFERLVSTIARSDSWARPTVSSTANAVESVRETLAALSERDRRARLVDLVCEQVTIVLGHDSTVDVEPERSFSDLGFDSLTAVELRNRLGARVEVSLPATVVFDHPSPIALAHHIEESLDIPTEADVAETSTETEIEALGVDDLVRMALYPDES